MQRDYAISKNARDLKEGDGSEELKRTSAYLAERHLDLLDRLLDGSRSRNLRRILDSVSLTPNEVLVLSEKEANHLEQEGENQ